MSALPLSLVLESEFRSDQKADEGEREGKRRVGDESIEEGDLGIFDHFAELTIVIQLLGRVCAAQGGERRKAAVPVVTDVAGDKKNAHQQKYGEPSDDRVAKISHSMNLLREV